MIGNHVLLPVSTIACATAAVPALRAGNGFGLDFDVAPARVGGAVLVGFVVYDRWRA